eukprot:TRINITY_DN4712_c0_g2_i9.p1 TRINITY_DN4712_c0_g2~~TRINITY_DN4712_c0_g2_i9.p1  ORF type:complete len:154 (-),score=28.12 TRINITY_DN4712_c0_g2_i9:125-586(-)
MRALLLDMGAWSVPGVHFDKKLMCQAIAQSLFRQGRFDLGEAFCRECGLEMKEVSITHPRSLSLSLSLSLSVLYSHRVPSPLLFRHPSQGDTSLGKFDSPMLGYRSFRTSRFPRVCLPLPPSLSLSLSLSLSVCVCVYVRLIIIIFNIPTFPS